MAGSGRDWRGKRLQLGVGGIDRLEDRIDCLRPGDEVFVGSLGFPARVELVSCVVGGGDAGVGVATGELVGIAFVVALHMAWVANRGEARFPGGKDLVGRRLHCFASRKRRDVELKPTLGDCSPGGCKSEGRVGIRECDDAGAVAAEAPRAVDLVERVVAATATAGTYGGEAHALGARGDVLLGGL